MTAAAEPNSPASGRRVVGRSVMLAVLVCAFALSHAFRTLPAITAGQIGAEFGASPRQIGLFAGIFHLAFAAMQIPVGVALDRYGPRRTVSLLFVAAILGAALAAGAPTFPLLLTGQVLLGIGCSPALMGAMVFVGRRYPADRFAAVSGVIIAAGSLGLLATATPLAWVVQHWSWRVAFAILAVLSTAAAAACWRLVDDRDKATDGQADREGLWEATRNVVGVVAQRQAAGILVLGLVTYSIPITVRALWIVPLFTERYGFSLVETGNVVFALSIAMIAGPLLFGRADPGPAARRRLIVATALATALILAALALRPVPSAALDMVLAFAFGVMSSFYVLQFADVRSSYSMQVAGRALAALNMAIFLGVATVQWSSGIVAEAASARGLDALSVVLGFLAVLLVSGAVAFAALPGGSRRAR